MMLEAPHNVSRGRDGSTQMINAGGVGPLDLKLGGSSRSFLYSFGEEGSDAYLVVRVTGYTCAKRRHLGKKKASDFRKGKGVAFTPIRGARQPGGRSLTQTRRPAALTDATGVSLG